MILWLGGFSFGPFVVNPFWEIKTSFLAVAISSLIISFTKSSNLVEAFQPSSFEALVGSPKRVSTSHGRKYLESILITVAPLSALMPISSKPYILSSA